ncbi:MAG: SprT-like domain-containing protein [Planctomycetota bacterium]
MEQINTELRRHSTNVPEKWDHIGWMEFCYRWLDLFAGKFFETPLPPCVISFDRTRITRRGHFVLGRNGYGVEYAININSVYLSEKDRVRILVTLIHEMVHARQYDLVKNGIARKLRSAGSRNYHGKFFVDTMRNIGIECDSKGHTLGYGDPFIQFLRENGIEEARPVPKVEPMAPLGMGLVTGPGSNLKKWVCNCGYGVRVAIEDFRAKCLACGTVFRRADGQTDGKEEH